MTTISKFAYIFSLLFGVFIDFRDPAQHSALKSEIEHQSTALYSTARLWDDGIIAPTDTRNVLGLGLALAARKHRVGDSKGFGVFRM